MPFDGIENQTIASKMRAIFGPRGEHWGQHHAYIERTGGAKYCMLGAIYQNAAFATHSARFAAVELVLKAIKKQNTMALVAWNDSRNRRWRDIAAALNRMEEIELKEKVNAV